MGTKKGKNIEKSEGNQKKTKERKIKNLKLNFKHDLTLLTWRPVSSGELPHMQIFKIKNYFLHYREYKTYFFYPKLHKYKNYKTFLQIKSKFNNAITV